MRLKATTDQVIKRHKDIESTDLLTEEQKKIFTSQCESIIRIL